MYRKLGAVLTLVMLGLITLPGLAAAYPAPPVTPTPAPTPVPYTPTSTSSTALADTGAGFDAGLVAIVAGLVVAVGIALLVVGSRLRKSPTGR